jgi:adenylylsulfate kinase
MDAGVVVLCAFISPFEEDRRCVRERLGGDRYLEVYVRCSLETCESRDPKDQYKKARAGLIKNYTGVSTPYEEPRNPDLTIDTEEVSVHGAVSSLLSVMSERHFLRLENESDRPLE